ncbi:MAG: DMT family transporter [Bacteroidota bacterium]
MNSRELRWFYLIVLSIIWGSSFILMKKALLDLTPVQVGSLRMIITAIVLFLVGFKKISSISGKDWFYIFLTALLGTFIPVFLFAYAIQNIDSSITSILNSLTPLNTLIIGVLFFGTAFIRKQFIGIIVGLLGAIFLIIKGAQMNPDQNYYYAFFIIIASVGYSYNVNVIKKHLDHLSALTITTGNFLFLIVPALIILWNTGFFEFKNGGNLTVPLIYIVILAIFGTALAKTLFNKLIKVSSPVFSSSVTYLIPIVAVFWGVLDGEKLYFSQFAASGLILLGVYLINKAK